MKVTGKTDRGIVRTENQDALIAEHLSDEAALIVVCDGMGGVSGGNVASEIAVKAIKDEFYKAYNTDDSNSSVKEKLCKSVTVANNIIYGIASNETQLSGMGTTVVAAFIRKNTAVVIHAGDSRAYLIGDDTITQITKDHSFVQEMVDLGKLSKEEARIHPKKNIITRALGVAEKVDAEVNELTLNSGDVLLICTDGLTNHVGDDEILRLVKATENPCGELIELAKMRGGSDNITIAIAKAE